MFLKKKFNKCFQFYFSFQRNIFFFLTKNHLVKKNWSLFRDRHTHTSPLYVDQHPNQPNIITSKLQTSLLTVSPVGAEMSSPNLIREQRNLNQNLCSLNIGIYVGCHIRIIINMPLLLWLVKNLNPKPF